MPERQVLLVQVSGAIFNPDEHVFFGNKTTEPLDFPLITHARKDPRAQCLLVKLPASEVLSILCLSYGYKIITCTGSRSDGFMWTLTNF